MKVQDPSGDERAVSRRQWREQPPPDRRSQAGGWMVVRLGRGKGMGQAFRECGGWQGGQGIAMRRIPACQSMAGLGGSVPKRSRVPGGEGSWCQAEEGVEHL